MEPNLIVMNVTGSEASEDASMVHVNVNIVMSPPVALTNGVFTGGQPVLILPADLTESEMKAAIEDGAIDWVKGQTVPMQFGAGNLRRIN